MEAAQRRWCPVGLPNPWGGNYCYLNATLQVMFRCEELMRVLAENPLDVSELQRRRQNSLLSGSTAPPAAAAAAAHPGQRDPPTRGQLQGNDDDDDEVGDVEIGRCGAAASTDVHSDCRPSPAPPSSASSALAAQRWTLPEALLLLHADFEVFQDVLRRGLLPSHPVRTEARGSLKISLKRFRKAVEEERCCFKKGEMNDASEFFEFLMDALSGEPQDTWGPAPATSPTRPPGTDQGCRQLSGRCIDSVVGYPTQRLWQCANEQCPAFAQARSIKGASRVARVYMHQLLGLCRGVLSTSGAPETDSLNVEEAEVDAGAGAGAAPSQPTFGQLAIATHHADERGLCDRCETPLKVRTAALRPPRACLMLHCVWARAPVADDIQTLLVHALEEEFSPEQVLGIRISGQGRSAATAVATVTGAVLFRGQHYTAVVRAPMVAANAHEWAHIDDARAVVIGTSWADVVHFCVKECWAPLLLGCSIHSRCGGIPRSARARLALPPPSRPSGKVALGRFPSAPLPPPAPHRAPHSRPSAAISDLERAVSSSATLGAFPAIRCGPQSSDELAKASQRPDDLARRLQTVMEVTTCPRSCAVALLERCRGDPALAVQMHFAPEGATATAQCADDGGGRSVAAAAATRPRSANPASAAMVAHQMARQRALDDGSGQYSLPKNECRGGGGGGAYRGVTFLMLGVTKLFKDACTVLEANGAVVHTRPQAISAVLAVAGFVVASDEMLHEVVQFCTGPRRPSGGETRGAAAHAAAAAAPCVAEKLASPLYASRVVGESFVAAVAEFAQAGGAPHVAPDPRRHLAGVAERMRAGNAAAATHLRAALAFQRQ